MRIVGTLMAVGIAVGSVMAASSAGAGPPAIPGARLERLAFSDVAGWSADDQEAAFTAFRRTCAAIRDQAPALRSGVPTPPALAKACRALVSESLTDSAQARALFERFFTPWRVVPDGGGTGFLTGYFEPQVEGALQPTPVFSRPLLARPSDLVTWLPAARPPGAPEGLEAARTDAGGRLTPYPARSEIEAGALGVLAKPLVWLDPVDAFMVHVQGSSRVRLPDGTTVRVAYAGRNGQPYVSVGKRAVEEGDLTLENATADRLYAYMKANPARGEALMRQNPSYIFFRLADELDPALGPVGAASVPLTAGRSLAVDRHIWPYGLPMMVGADLSDIEGPSSPRHRLAIAQDTGSAILGPARADLFLGSGDAAGIAAGRVRHSLDLVVLWPKDRP